MFRQTERSLLRQLQERLEIDECDILFQEHFQREIDSHIRSQVSPIQTLVVRLANLEKESRNNPLSLIYTFNILFSIDSLLENHDYVEYTRASFDSAAEQVSLVSFMNNLGDECEGFSDIDAVIVDASELNATLPAIETPSSESGTSVGIIVGIVVAIVAIALLLLIFVYSRLRGSASSSGSPLSLEEALEEGNDLDAEYISAIGVKTAPDVSTLGDPIPLGAGGSLLGDMSTNDSVSLDYDYQKAYLDIPSVADVSGTTGENETIGNILVPADDDTFDAQYIGEKVFEIAAPPGVLGLILETNRHGVPTVNAIKPSSALEDQVKVGDRLISVDDQDVTVMLASDVSRLIASKRDQDVRKFVFTRPVRKIGDPDDNDGSLFTLDTPND